MAEYIEREELINQIRLMVNRSSVGETSLNDISAKTICGLILEAPTADVVEVVMCEKCKHCEFGYPEKRINEQAKEGYYCRLEKRYKDPNFYCSYGERKEGKEE